MKNILFMVTKSQNGGAQKWTKEQIEICSNNFNCFLATDEDGWLSQNVQVQDKFLNKLIYRRLSFSYLLLLNKFIKYNNINLIIASSANAGIYSRLIKLFNEKIKVIYVSHGWSSIYNGGKLAFLYTFIERQLSKISDSILCISKKDFQNAKDIIKINDNKLKWITNKIYPIKNREILKKQDEKIKLLTVARLEIPKRVDLLIEATKDLNDVELHIVGDGSQRNYLESIKHKNVIFYGEIDGFNDFKNYDIFALISDSEGLPLSALEAMSSKLPIILSDVGGCFELIDENGILVKNNIDEIKNAIINTISNNNKFSEKSLKLFNNSYNLELNRNSYINYYKDISND
ncbi:glycosyltransferase [Arcobacter aquimarinus]|uniref:Glycosyltransferase, family 1 n=1 Tax=Arcobacter aquimarinus TaxID=1315211 RepID=A0AAE7E154_9BACT|nr:glycosyltransferase [Arcobacter aquimarinus]QKE26738.1 glycosyltransferase, family 1 [Arcobacter aquimarinus]RXI34458.1 glycosyl transferase [Arcobacter aquimarinus]